MKLSQLNEKMLTLKTKRSVLHAELDEILVSDDLSVKKAAIAEKKVRSKIKAVNDELFPMEQERAEIDRMVKGKPRKQKESYLDEEVTLG